MERMVVLTSRHWTVSLLRINDMSASTLKLCSSVFRLLGEIERYSCQNTLQRYHLLGVLLAKAITQNVTLPQSTRLSHYIIKHILGCPLTILDLEVMSKEYHKSILDVQGMAQEDIASMDLTFISSSGVPLVPGGEAKTVSSENVAEYIHEMLRHKLFTSVKKQLQEIVRGFTSVIPRALLIPFNPQELELILYGLGTIDVQALKDSSLCSADATNCVEWFWEIFNEYSDEMKARTLHFVTGMSGWSITSCYYVTFMLWVFQSTPMSLFTSKDHLVFQQLALHPSFRCK